MHGGTCDRNVGKAEASMGQKLEEQGGEQHLMDQLGLRWEESKAC